MAVFDDILNVVKTGASFIPGVGTAISAGLGLVDMIGDAIDPDDPKKKTNSRYEAYVAGQLAKLSDDGPSAEYQASRADANLAFARTSEKIQNAPGVGGNANVTARLQELAQQGLGMNLIKAQATESGRQRDRREAAARLGLQQEQLDIANQQYADSYNDTPGFAKSLGRSAISEGVGIVLGRGLPGVLDEDGDADGDTGAAPDNDPPAVEASQLPLIAPPTPDITPMPLMQDFMPQSPTPVPAPSQRLMLKADPDLGKYMDIGIIKQLSEPRYASGFSYR